MTRKKTGLIVVASLATLLLAMIILPFAFEGSIASRVKRMANESLNAKLDFKDVDISLFRSFPQLDVRLNELTLTGINDFAGMPLLSIGTLSTSVSLSSLWNSGGLTISEIALKNPRVNLLVNSTGKANWDISKSTTPASSANGKNPVRIDLTKVQLINSSLTYRDDQLKMTCGLSRGDFGLSGYLKGSDSKLSFTGKADSIAVDYNGQKLIQGMKVTGEGSLQADFDQMSFRFMNNKFLINSLPLELQGTFMMGAKADKYDLTFQSNGASLAELIGFLPQDQQQRLKPYEKGGALSFTGTVAGTYSGQDYPAIKADLKLTNGRLKYPTKSLEINGIRLEASLNKPQGVLDSTKISVPQLMVNLAGHPVVANLSVTTPVSNPIIAGEILAEIDFPALKQAIPVDSMEIGGTVRANIKFNGPSSAIERGEYDRFQTKGEVSLLDFFYRSPMFPDRLSIQSAKYTFDAKAITITTMKGKLGISDFTVDGNITNYWAYILKNGTIQGNIQVKSDQLDVTQLMNGGTQSKDSTFHSDPYVIPARVDFTIQAAVNRMLYNRMEIRGTTGKLVVKDQKLTLDQLSMNLLKGKMVLSGIYSCQEKNPADFNFKMEMKDFDLPSAYQSLGVVRHLLPIAGNSKGSFFSGMSLSGKLGRDYAPDFSALNGSGQIGLKNVELTGNNLFADIGKYFRKELFTNVKVSDFTSNLTITNGALAISPFMTKIANQEVTISGGQSLALDLNYLFDFKVNKNDLSQDVTGLIGLVPGTENIDKYPIKIELKGNLKKPEVKVDLSEAKTLVANEFRKKAKSTLQDAVKKLGLENLFK